MAITVSAELLKRMGRLVQMAEPLMSMVPSGDVATAAR
jgi:hypothetical protein